MVATIQERVHKDGICNACQHTVPIKNSGLCEGCYRDLKKRRTYGAPANVRVGQFHKDQSRIGLPRSEGGTGALVGLSKDELKQVYDDMTPTPYAPGTHEKLWVMEERAKLGLPLYHPQDADFSGKGISLTVSRDVYLESIK